MTQSAWLIDTSGSWCRPGNLSVDDLDEGFVHDDWLHRALGMQNAMTQELAAALGIDTEAFALLRSNRDELVAFVDSLRSQPDPTGDLKSDEDAGEGDPGAESGVSAAIQRVFKSSRPRTDR